MGGKADVAQTSSIGRVGLKFLGLEQPFAWQNSQEKPEPVLDVLAHTEDTVIVVTRLHDGKFKVMSKSWDEEKVVLPDQVLELRMVSGRIRVARKTGTAIPATPRRRSSRVGVEGEIAEFM